MIQGLEMEIIDWDGVEVWSLSTMSKSISLKKKLRKTAHYKEKQLHWKFKTFPVIDDIAWLIMQMGVLFGISVTSKTIAAFPC